MKLYDIVKNKNYPDIEVRVYDVDGKDMLFGFCSYVDGKLTSIDGDSYSLDMEVNEWEVFDDTLVVVCHTCWYNGSSELLVDTRDIKCINAIERIRGENGN